MHAANRLGLVFLLLIACFLALVGYAAASLVLAGERLLAAAVALAGLAGVVGGVLVWLLAREEGDVQEPAEVAPPAQPLPQALPQLARAPLRVQTMPVANLPPAYLAAVMKGAHARLDALKAQARQPDAR